VSFQVYGGGAYGLADETSDLGLYIASASYDLSADTNFGKDHIGEDALIAVGNEGGSMSFSGLVSTADTLGAGIGDALQAADIANSTLFSVTGSITVWIVNGGNLTRNNAGFQEGSLEMVGRSAMTSAVAETVS